MTIPKKIKQFFESVSSMALSTVDENKTPNVVAIATTKIVDDDTIWVIDTYFDKTKTNLCKNNKVAIALWKKGEGYQIKGVAKYCSEGESFEKARKWILKTKPQKIVKGLVEIKVTDIYFITPDYKIAGKRLD